MSDNKKKTIVRKTTEVKGDKLIVHGAGLFNESSLFLNKEQAMLLYVDLHKFISKFT